MKKMMLTAGFLLVASAAGAADKSREAQPEGDGGAAAWFSTDDYPAEALAVEAEGTAAVQYDIDAQGRVIFCTVTQTSGSAVLDETTCRLMKERARFVPALDARGRPVASKGERRVTWQMPKRVASPMPLSILPVRVTMTTDVDEQGVRSNCEIGQVGFSTFQVPAAEMGMTCENNEFLGGDVRFIGDDGKPVKARVQISVELKVVPAGK